MKENADWDRKSVARVKYGQWDNSEKSPKILTLPITTPIISLSNYTFLSSYQFDL